MLIVGNIVENNFFLQELNQLDRMITYLYEIWRQAWGWRCGYWATNFHKVQFFLQFKKSGVTQKGLMWHQGVVGRTRVNRELLVLLWFLSWDPGGRTMWRSISPNCQNLYSDLQSNPIWKKTKANCTWMEKYWSPEYELMLYHLPTLTFSS